MTGNPTRFPAMRSDGKDILLKVRAAPGASRERVAGVLGDALKIAVAAPPEKGKANLAIARVLAVALGLPASRVRLDSGAASRDKWYRIVDGSPEQVEILVRKNNPRKTP